MQTFEPGTKVTFHCSNQEHHHRNSGTVACGTPDSDGEYAVDCGLHFPCRFASDLRRIPQVGDRVRFFCRAQSHDHPLVGTLQSDTPDFQGDFHVEYDGGFCLFARNIEVVEEDVEEDLMTTIRDELEEAYQDLEALNERIQGLEVRLIESTTAKFKLGQRVTYTKGDRNDLCGMHGKIESITLIPGEVLYEVKWANDRILTHPQEELASRG